MGVVVGVAGVDVVVGVTVRVTVGVAVGSTTRPVSCKAKNTRTAPIPRKRANNTRATGKLNVISGIRLPCVAFVFCEDFSPPVRLLPQTRQRMASSLTRVPQVGQSFVGFEGVSEVIGVCKAGLSSPNPGDYTLFSSGILIRRWFPTVSTCIFLFVATAAPIVISIPTPG